MRLQQPTLKLSNKINFTSLCIGIRDQRLTVHARVILLTHTLRDGSNPFSKRRLYSKVKIANFIFGNQTRKQTFFNFLHAHTDLGTILSSSHHFTPRSADAILVRIETTKSFEIYLMYMLD